MTSPATILFLFGEDTYRSHRKLRQIMDRYIDASLGDTNLAILDGGTIQFDVIVRQIQALPFLAKTRLVVIRNLLLTGKKDVCDQVSAYLDRIPSSTVVVFYEAGQPDRRTKLFKQLNQPKRVEYFPLLQGVALNRWLSLATLERQLRLAPAGQKLLLERVGNDLWRLANELDKLAAYQVTQPPETSLDLSALDALVVGQAPTDVFRLVEAITRRAPTQALTELARLLEQGEAELYLFAMIVYQFRTLLILKEAVQEGYRSPAALARVIKIAPFVAEKNLRFLESFTLEQIIAAEIRILSYDRAMKVGEIEPRIALELLIGELTTLPRPRG